MPKTQVKNKQNLKFSTSSKGLQNSKVKSKSQKISKASLSDSQKVKVEKKSLQGEKNLAGAKNVGLSVSVYGLDGKVSGKVNLPAEIFGEEKNPKLIAQAVRVYLANQRMGTASTKTRSEVAGSKKKIYRQKGTGRARHGAKKAPIFVGGGITFGPRPRDFGLSIPKKMKKKALFSALSEKFSQKKVLVVDFEKATGKTKEIANALKNLSLQDKKNIMIVVDKNLENVKKASGNIENVNVENVSNLNTYGVLKSSNILFVKNTIESLKNIFMKGK